MADFVANKLSFDDPVELPPIPDTLAADPLVMAIHLHEESKLATQQARRPLEEAEVEFIRLKRIRDEISIQLKAAQADFDHIANQKHEAEKKWKACASQANVIAEHVQEMGALIWGNNCFVTPAQMQAWQEIGASPFGDYNTKGELKG